MREGLESCHKILVSTGVSLCFLGKVVAFFVSLVWETLCVDLYRYIAHPYIIWCDFTVTDRGKQLSFFFAGQAVSNLSSLCTSFLGRGRRIFTAFPSIMDSRLFFANGNDCGFIFALFSFGRARGQDQLCIGNGL